MSISSFNLSRSKSRKTRGSQYPRHDRFHRTVPDFDNDWQALRSPTRSHSGIKIRANNRLHSHSRSKIGDRRSWRDEHGERECERARSSGTKSHSHSVELDAINVIININNVIGHKKKPRSGNETIPPCNAPHYSFPTLLQHARVNTDALTALNQIFDYFDLEVLQTPQRCVRPAHPLIKPKSRSQQQLKLTRTHTHTLQVFTRDQGLGAYNNKSGLGATIVSLSLSFLLLPSAAASQSACQASVSISMIFVEVPLERLNCKRIRI